MRDSNSDIIIGRGWPRSKGCNNRDNSPMNPSSFRERIFCPPPSLPPSLPPSHPASDVHLRAERGKAAGISVRRRGREDVPFRKRSFVSISASNLRREDGRGTRRATRSECLSYLLFIFFVEFESACPIVLFNERNAAREQRVSRLSLSLSLWKISGFT